MRQTKSAARESVPARTPSVTFSTVTFSDGSSLRFEHNDIIVVVGPNNAGKSALLKDLESLVRSEGAGKVATDAKVHKTGSSEDFRIFLQANARRTSASVGVSYDGFGFNIPEMHLDQIWNDTFGTLGSVFVRRVGTDDRLSGSDPVGAIDTLRYSSSHPIHQLFVNSDLEGRVSSYFRRAFGEDLFVYHLGGAKWPLFVGQKPAFRDEENATSNSYLERIRDTCAELSTQGDGMRGFATVIINLLAAKTPSVLLLDEPEAFLHPPQAKILGEYLASTTDRAGQIFISTHSPDVVIGLLNFASDRMKIIRLEREGSHNRINVLDRERTKEIARDPLLKFSGVLSGMFHRRVVVCEGDADCLFYSAILDLPEVRGAEPEDVLFVHGGGKQRMAQLVVALKALGVRVDVVADIDVLNDGAVLRPIVESLGGNWSEIAKIWKPLHSEIERRRAVVKPSIVIEAIRQVLGRAEKASAVMAEDREEIRAALKSVSPWEVLKEGGEHALPSGDATTRYNTVKSKLQELGLWIVPVGELEGFCKSIGGKSGWVQKVLATKSLANDEELASARAFLKSIWLHAKSPQPDNSVQVVEA